MCFGRNGFLHLVQITPSEGLAFPFMGTLIASHCLIPVFAIAVAAGVMLLVNNREPLAVLGAIIVNILLNQVLVAPKGLGVAATTKALMATLAHRERAAFATLFPDTANRYDATNRS